MNKNTIYIISIIALVLAIIIFFIILRLSSLKKLRTKARELEKQRNLIVSTPIMSELSKIEVILKNEKLEEKLEQWKKRYEIIKGEKYDAITDKLLELDGLIEDKDIKESKEKAVELEMEIYKLRVITDNLLDEIREVTMSEERNRAIVTKLKSRYRDLERTFNNNSNAYQEI